MHNKLVYYKQVDAQKYNAFTNEQKCDFLSQFAFFTNKHIYNIQATRGNINISEPTQFDYSAWSTLALSTQIAILKSLKDLDKFSNREYQIDNNRKFSGPWSSFAEHMIPTILKIVYLHYHGYTLATEDRKEFFTILAENEDYAKITNTDGTIQEIRTLLTAEGVNTTLSLAAKNLNITFMLMLVKLKDKDALGNITDVFFENSMVKAWQEILNHPDPQLAADAATEFLNYFNNNTRFLSIKHRQLNAQCQKIIAAHCIKHPEFTSYFDHHKYNIQLSETPAIPEEKSWLPHFQNFKHKDLIAGAVIGISLNMLFNKMKF
jgi:hypothetical protein